MCLGRTEDRHGTVTEKLVDLAAFGPGGANHNVKERVKHAQHVAGRESLSQPGTPDDIDKQDARVESLAADGRCPAKGCTGNVGTHVARQEISEAFFGGKGVEVPRQYGERR